MDHRLKNGIAISLLPQVFIVKWLGSYPEIIESYYSLGIYPIISETLRAMYGWLPFSAGDIIYTLLLFTGMRYIYLNRRRLRWKPLPFLRNILVVLSVAYFTFHLLWGLNYYRRPLNRTLGLQSTHTYSELTDFTEKLILATNSMQQTLVSDSTQPVAIPYTKMEFFDKTREGYSDLRQEFPRFAYHQPSVKLSLFSTLLSYMGYGGYLNPFTNEAQVNSRLPSFRFPVVAGHEIGHQIGYSAENETNFVGYLVTLKNRDPYLKYAAMAYALSYCLNEIHNRDASAFRLLYSKINSGVQKNYEEMNAFWESYANPLEPVFKGFFNSFLKANNQPAGLQSYNMVVSLMVAYHKRHPF